MPHAPVYTRAFREWKPIIIKNVSFLSVCAVVWAIGSSIVQCCMFVCSKSRIFFHSCHHQCHSSEMNVYSLCTLFLEMVSFRIQCNGWNMWRFFDGSTQLRDMNCGAAVISFIISLSVLSYLDWEDVSLLSNLLASIKLQRNSKSISQFTVSEIYITKEER